MSKSPLNPAAMEMLARMSDDWTDTTGAMLSVTVALIMRRLDMTCLTVPLNPHDIKHLIDTVTIDRTYEDVNGVLHMTVILTPKEWLRGQTDDAPTSDASDRTAD